LFAVDRQGGFGERRPDTHRIDHNGGQAEQNDGDPGRRVPLERNDPGDDRQDEQAGGDDGTDAYAIAHDTAQPEPATEWPEAARQRYEFGVERHAGVSVTGVSR